ncbi:MAG: acyltransferase [Cyclobacteriaceae bacterium]
MNRFRRITTSNKFIPEIDGLRFIAIFAVIISHVYKFYYKENMADFQLKPGENDFIHGVLSTTGRGVELFFIISGFILAIPFIRQYAQKTTSVNLISYFSRRLTRLEPPYLIIMTLFFLMRVVLNTDPFSELSWAYLASIFYLHNAIFNEFSIINSVAWSLEIEIQFYILVPVLTLVFSLAKSSRRILIAFTIIALCFTTQYFEISRLWIGGNLHYFLIGFILADLYVFKDQIKFKLSKSFLFISGIILLLIVFAVPVRFHSTSQYPDLSYFLKGVFILCFCISSFILYYLVIFNRLFDRFFTNVYITSIGGMCYSIYLIHAQVIYFFGTKLHVINLVFTNIFPLDVLIQIVLFGSIAIVISGIFFLLIEKPCMNPNWIKKIPGSFRLIK